MAKTDDRFEIIYKQGVAKGQRIIVDKETGVRYNYERKIPSRIRAERGESGFAGKDLRWHFLK